MLVDMDNSLIVLNSFFDDLIEKVSNRNFNTDCRHLIRGEYFRFVFSGLEGLVIEDSIGLMLSSMIHRRIIIMIVNNLL